MVGELGVAVRLESYIKIAEEEKGVKYVLIVRVTFETAPIELFQFFRLTVLLGRNWVGVGWLKEHTCI